MHQNKTACPLNCYDVCGFLVTTEEGKITKVDGDPDHPITKGKICGKGKMIKDRMYHSKRIVHPLKKVDGTFVRITWDQAISEIAEKMKKAKQQYGPTSILHSYDYASGGLLKGLDRRFFHYFGGMTEVVGSLCWGAGKQAQIYDFGDALSHKLEDVLHANVIMIWGRNITTTNMHLLPYLKKAKQNGKKIIVIDPIRNGIAKLADIHVQIKPGMDGLLAVALSKLIIEHGWHDRSFIEQHSIGFEAYYDELKEISLSKISKEINIEEDVLLELAKLYAQEGPVATFLGLGMQRYANGGNTVRAIDALAAITGNIGVAGGGVNYANLAVGKSFNWEPLIREDLCKEYRSFSRPTQAEEVINADDPPIQMLFVTRSNPVSQLPNAKRTIHAFKQIETKVVVDMFMTDTAALADYILPTTSVFEEEDIYYGSMLHGIIRYGPKLVDPPGEAKSDLEIWSALAEVLDLKDFKKSNETFLDIALETLAPHGINLSRLKKKGQLALPLPSVAWEDKRFTTPSGKYEFYSYMAKKEGLSGTAKVIYPWESAQNQPELKDKYPFHLLSIHPMKSLHSQHYMVYQKKESLTIYISKEVGRKYQLKDGDRVRIFNDRGQLTGVVRMVDGYHPETIVIEEGWSMATKANANILTPNGLADMGKGSMQYDCAVAIERIEDRY